MSGEMVAAVPPAALDGLSQIQCWPGNAEQSASPKKTDVTIALVSPEQPAKRRRVGRPRKLEPEWHTTASRTELVRCFLWEVGQGFKHHFINNISFNSRKLVFTQDYTKVVPKEELELTALEHFAPPIQRYIAVLSKLLHRCPGCQHVETIVLSHVFSLSQSLTEIKSKCRDFFLGPLSYHKGKLTMRLPKAPQYKGRSARWPIVRRLLGPENLNIADARVVGFPPWYDHEPVLIKSMWKACEAWWRQKPERAGTQEGEVSLARAILSAEAAISMGLVGQILELHSPRTPTDPHSLELVIKICDPNARESSWPHASMVVPHDLAVTELFKMIEQHMEKLWVSDDGEEMGLTLTGSRRLHVIDLSLQLRAELKRSEFTVSSRFMGDTVLAVGLDGDSALMVGDTSTRLGDTAMALRLGMEREVPYQLTMNLSAIQETESRSLTVHRARELERPCCHDHNALPAQGPNHHKFKCCRLLGGREAVVNLSLIHI
eukprot:TRINITY_DN15638_c0_g1_i2.p1 TRINITY_DN15638_c0_g1~~TRINITY_DN15638_c0_g1_i2.p1  ORF type:complete len:490 (+),score=75.73 TRINITY_DN15638_c0_g1_i2:228-1697(+)